MKIRALISFSGVISMHQGEEREFAPDEVLEDLICANYVEVIESSSSPEQKVVEDPKSAVTENQIDTEKQEIAAESTDGQQAAKKVEKEAEPTPEVATPKAATSRKKTSTKGVK